MVDTLNIAMAQINPTVGDVTGNCELVRVARAEAAAQGADLLVCAELVVSGYPPEDLVLRPAFQAEVRRHVEALAAETADGGPALLLTAPWLLEGGLYNAALLLDGGAIRDLRTKWNLPNYGVFDEKRVFVQGPMSGPMPFRDVRLGVMICEDMWTPDVAETLVETGAELLLVPNGSPYDDAKAEIRMNLAVERVTETGLPLLYVNQVGGQDDLVFDGGSFVLNADRSLAVQCRYFQPAVVTTTWRRGPRGWACDTGQRHAPPERDAGLYQAMMLGLRDYVNKNRFPGVVLGMSGGIDSALSAVVAADALGPARVWCVMMPSRYTGNESVSDAAACAGALGVRLDTVAIEPAVEAFGQMLAPLFMGREPDLTEENIQSRSRGLTLMAISNKFGHMVLTTGNKSEMSVGYATLYGDMCGGYSVLKDLYKVQVFALARWRNANLPEGALGPAGEVVPHNILVKPPSAELRPDQTDQDSLPEYEDLDLILNGLVEEEKSVAEIVAQGQPLERVRRIQHLLFIAEYKRRQSAPGVKLTRRNFGRDRRYPITNGFRDPT